MASDIEFFNGAPSFTVGQFGEVVNGILKASFDEGVWVEGEIEGLRKPNPHAYFNLIENVDGKKAQVNVNIWAGQLRNVQAKLRNQGIELKDGLKVRLFSRPDYYAPFGKLSLVVSDVDTQFSAGDIAAKREELLKRLHDTGITRRNKAIPVPLVPLRLGIISSSTAAGWADARQHLIESEIGFSITFKDVRVQGEDAVRMVVGAIKDLSSRTDIDVILLMRGGGSKSDLAAFDAEEIAMAIAECPYPVFTGIGHEIDSSVADAVAHTACKTPTACADAIIEYVEDFLGLLNDRSQLLQSRTQTALERSRTKLAVANDRLRTRPTMTLDRVRNKLNVIAETVRLLDPAHTMARGWSITRNADGKVVRSTDDVANGETLVTSVADGTITSTVDATSKGTK
jgi:exodeoxyribonuclease VII large subunit